MSNIVMNDLEHNIELDRKSLIELKGGTGLHKKKRKKLTDSEAANKLFYYIRVFGISHDRSSFRRGPHKGPFPTFVTTDIGGSFSSTASG